MIFLCHMINVAQKSHRPSKNRIQRSLSAGYPGGFGGFRSECIICRKTAIVVVVVVVVVVGGGGGGGGGGGVLVLVLVLVIVLVIVLVLVLVLVLCCCACPRRTVIPPFQYKKDT